MILGVIVLLALIGGFWYYGYVEQEALVNELPLLSESSPEYAAGKMLFAEGKYAEARAQFEAALATTDADSGEALIKFAIALTTRREGDLVGAVKLYKEIANNETYPVVMRAHAVRSLAELSNSNDAVVRAEIFSSAPYSTFLVDSNRGRSTFNINTYASSLYPIALSELSIAAWYANPLARDARGTTELTVEQREEFRGIVEEKLSHADADLARIDPASFEGETIPSILRTRAIVLGRMAVAGFIEYADADAAFAEAESAATGQDVEVARTRYWYAVHLSAQQKYGPAIALVDPVIANVDAAEAFGALVMSGRLVPEEKLALGSLAAQSPALKTFLLSHGWIEDDF